MRIRNESELNALVKAGQVNSRVAKALSKHFEAGEPAQLTPKAPKGLHTHKHASQSTNMERRKAREQFYTLPEWDAHPDPQVVLYRACVERWGRAYEGGLCVYELGFQVNTPFNGDKPKRWYIDTALPTYRIAIECDGYQYHSSLDAVKRDHLKSEFLQRHGWLVFRVGNARIKNDVHTFLDSIEHIMQYRTPGDWRSHVFSGTKKQASYRSLLLSWAPKPIPTPEQERFTLSEQELAKYG